MKRPTRKVVKEERCSGRIVKCTLECGHIRMVYVSQRHPSLECGECWLLALKEPKAETA